MGSQQKDKEQSYCNVETYAYVSFPERCSVLWLKRDGPSLSLFKDKTDSTG